LKRGERLPHKAGGPLLSRPAGQGIVAILLFTALLTGLGRLVARDFPPSVPPPKPFLLPVPQIHQLPNGLRVVVIERRSLPLVTLRLVVKSGPEADPPGLPGTAQLVAGLLSQGTARRSAQQIAETIDGVGGDIEASAEWDDSHATVTVLADNTELACDLLADMALHPAFAPAEIERQRKQTLSALDVLGDDPSYLADTVFDLLVFAGTPYGHPPDGTAESLRRISAQDLHAFHERYYRPSNSILAVVGDISSEQALVLARRYFGAWQDAPVPAPAQVAASPESRRIVVIDKPDAVQTEIRVGNLGIPRASPDYYALTVADQILGGPATNRLFKALRTQKGLAYGASSELDCQGPLGSWVAKTSTRTAETVKSLELVLEQMRRLSDQTLSGSELRTAQSYLIGHMALDFETSDDLASEDLELLVHGLPLDYWNGFPSRIEALDADQVLAATRRHLDPERNIIVLVGNARGFSGELKKLGPAQVIPLENLDFSSPTLERTAGQ
jgi:zinc protease